VSLDKNKTVAEIGRRTRLRNHDVQHMVEALIEVWTEELANSGRIEIQNFLVLEVKSVDRGQHAGHLRMDGKLRRAPRIIRRLTVKPGKQLRRKMNGGS
jgi:nucleoid DNA-binding protein